MNATTRAALTAAVLACLLFGAHARAAEASTAEAVPHCESEPKLVVLRRSVDRPQVPGIAVIAVTFHPDGTRTWSIYQSSGEPEMDRYTISVARLSKFMSPLHECRPDSGTYLLGVVLDFYLNVARPYITEPLRPRLVVREGAYSCRTREGFDLPFTPVGKPAPRGAPIVLLDNRHVAICVMPDGTPGTFVKGIDGRLRPMPPPSPAP